MLQIAAGLDSPYQVLIITLFILSATTPKASDFPCENSTWVSLIFVVTNPVTLWGFRSTKMWPSAHTWHVTDDGYPNNINYFTLVLEANIGSCCQATCRHLKLLPTHSTAVGLSYCTINLHNLPGSLKTKCKLEYWQRSSYRSRVFHMN